jgi:hypothetical protein
VAIRVTLIEEARLLSDVARRDTTLEQPAGDADPLRELEAMRRQAVRRGRAA